MIASLFVLFYIVFGSLFAVAIFILRQIRDAFMEFHFKMNDYFEYLENPVAYHRVRNFKIIKLE